MKRSLLLLSNAGIAGLLVFAALAFFTVSQIQVGSDFFEAKRLSNSVAADFENPPQSLQKVYSLAVEAEDAATPSERQSLIAEIHDAHASSEAAISITCRLCLPDRSTTSSPEKVTPPPKLVRRC